MASEEEGGVNSRQSVSVKKREVLIVDKVLVWAC